MGTIVKRVQLAALLVVSLHTVCSQCPKVDGAGLLPCAGCSARCGARTTCCQAAEAAQRLQVTPADACQSCCAANPHVERASLAMPAMRDVLPSPVKAARSRFACGNRYSYVADTHHP